MFDKSNSTKLFINEVYNYLS